METNDSIVSRFCNAFKKMDADELIAYFAEDAVYHNIPMPERRGRAEIYAAFKGLRGRFKGLEFETLHQVAVGNLVMNERIDHIVYEDRRLALPIMGVFELEGGLIRAWRDYFDLATLKNA